MQASSIETVNITNCDREPIHLLGQIQAHGVLLAVEEESFIIRQVSSNTTELLHLTPDNLCGQPLGEVIGEQQFSYLKQQLNHEQSLKDLNPLVWKFPDIAVSFDVVMHRSGGLLILELESSLPNLHIPTSDFFINSHKAIKKLEEMDNLPDLLKLIADKVKSLTHIDRVMVYQFQQDGHGEVVAEAKEAKLEPFLGLHYPASDIPKQARALYLKNKIRVISDVDSQPAKLIPSNNPILDEPLDLSYAHLRSVSPIHIQYLKNMGIKASMSISIIINEQLWGLVACHHLSPLFLSHEIRMECQFISQLLAWRIHNLELEEKNTELRAHRYHALQLYQGVTYSNNWLTGLQNQQEHLLKLVNASGIAICYEGRYIAIGETPSLLDIKKISNYIIKQDSTQVFASNNLMSVYSPAQSCKEKASGVLSIVLDPTEGDFIIWFRPEVLQVVNWAGNPDKAVIKYEQSERLMPRGSFALWQQEATGHSMSWKDSELEIAKEFKNFLLDVFLKHYSQTVQKIIELKKKQDDFVDMVCHELRNPLNGIIGSVDLLKQQLKELETLLLQGENPLSSTFKPQLNILIHKMQEDLTNTDACSAHQKLVIDSVLKLSRLEKGKQQLEILPFDLIALIKEAAAISDTVLRQKKLELKIKYAMDKSLVKGDKTLIKQVIINLLSNSIKFTDKGHIELQLNQLEDKNNHHVYEIRVIDTGIGMTGKEQNRLFRPYVQANTNISSTYGGSGLGLVISRQIVELMGGKISVKSEKGMGSTFSFTLELEPLNLEQQQQFISQLSSPDLATVLPMNFGKTILIVEDNLINRKILKNKLEQCGFICDVAINGQEGVAKFSKSKYDAIFMDIQMPIMDGFAATEAIRKIEQERDLEPVPIICLTGNAREIHKQRANEVGMTDYLTKPFTMDNILTILKKRLVDVASDSRQDIANNLVFN
jgi:chemotaxis family two-component system sensor kinase Cph1